MRAFAALRAVRKRRKPGGPLPVVLKPAASAARSEREEREAKFRHIREEDERLEEEERRPPAVVLKGRAVGPAVPQERGETSAKRVVKAKTEDVKKCPAGHSLKDFATTSDGWTCSMCEREYPENSLFRRCFQCDYDLCAACWCVAKRPGDKETEDEAPPPPPPSGKPRSRRAREVKDDDDESPPPPPPGKPPRGVPLSLRRPQSPQLHLLLSPFLGVHGFVRSAMVSTFRTRSCVDISLKVDHVLGRFGRRPNGLHMSNLRYREVRGRRDEKRGVV